MSALVFFPRCASGRRIPITTTTELYPWRKLVILHSHSTRCRHPNQNSCKLLVSFTANGASIENVGRAMIAATIVGL